MGPDGRAQGKLLGRARHVHLMRTTGQKWASYQSVKRVYTVNPVCKPKELGQFSFPPKNELNRLFGTLLESRHLNAEHRLPPQQIQL